jgi:hypothetical protein
MSTYLSSKEADKFLQIEEAQRNKDQIIDFNTPLRFMRGFLLHKHFNIDKTNHLTPTFYAVGEVLPPTKTKPVHYNLTDYWRYIYMPESLPHTQGKIFWYTETFYVPLNTQVPPLPAIIQPRQIRNTQSPFYLRVKQNIKATNYPNCVPGWLKRYEWSHKYFYPKVGTKILKHRKFPLDRKYTTVIRGGRTRGTRKQQILQFLKLYWAAGTTPKEVNENRPVHIEYARLNQGNSRLTRQQQDITYVTQWKRGCESKNYLKPPEYFEKLDRYNPFDEDDEDKVI